MDSVLGCWAGRRDRDREQGCAVPGPPVWVLEGAGGARRQQGFLDVQRQNWPGGWRVLDVEDARMDVCVYACVLVDGGAGNTLNPMPVLFLAFSLFVLRAGRAGKATQDLGEFGLPICSVDSVTVVPALHSQGSVRRLQGPLTTTRQ